MTQMRAGSQTPARAPLGRRFSRALARDWMLYIIIAPVAIYFVVFKYIPMYGLVIAFQDYSIFKGIAGSAWVGFRNFSMFFKSMYFGRLLTNTFLISLYSLIFNFPLPIILALLFNELRNRYFKSAAQTVSYLPHFVSTVVMVSMLTTLLSTNNGIVNNIIVRMGGSRISFLQEPSLFRTIYVSSGAWQGAGWGSIIYLAAISGVSPELYEAATIDGAGRFGRVWHITLPAILPTIMILLIMNLGNLLSVGYEKILLLYNELTYDTADVISTYVYRKGILDMSYGFSTAVDLFNSLINLTLLALANQLSKRASEVSLW